MRDGLVGAAVYLTLIAVQEGRHALTARALGGSSLIRALAGVSVTAAPNADYPVVAAAEVAGAVWVDAAEGLDV